MGTTNTHEHFSRTTLLLEDQARPAVPTPHLLTLLAPIPTHTLPPSLPTCPIHSYRPSRGTRGPAFGRPARRLKRSNALASLRSPPPVSLLDDGVACLSKHTRLFSLGPTLVTMPWHILA